MATACRSRARGSACRSRGAESRWARCGPTSAACSRFSPLETGTFELRLCDHWAEASQEVGLTDGETRDVVLRPAGSVLLWGRTSRAGRLLRRQCIELEGAMQFVGSTSRYPWEETLRTDDAGIYRVLLPPGEYELWIYGTDRHLGLPAGSLDARFSARRCVSSTVELRGSSARVRVDLELPGTEIGVRVVSARDRVGVRGAQVVARNESTSVWLASGAAGELCFEDLPFGAWELTATASGCSASAPQRVELHAGARSATCEFALVVGEAR